MLQKKNANLLFIAEGEKTLCFLSIISIDSGMIIHYIAEENIFVVTVYMLSVQTRF